ncbi:ORC2 [Acanthosepion pharaonis]|uniref:Origin recognition complex subunit 2 n=1 Tax=Acanthosepion pharaonis TaxID=158019 RepID=A0A812AWN2_ACAPH|nr:ORC2 [Sepia pharaonis]
MSDDEDVKKVLAPQKKIRVRFVGDDDIVQHILHIKEKKRGKKSLVSYGTKKSRTAIINDQEVVLGSSDEEEDSYRLSEALAATDEMTIGKELFTFKTPKKSGAMAQKALDSRTPRTPTSQIKKDGDPMGTPKTPKTPGTLKAKKNLNGYATKDDQKSNDRRKMTERHSRPETTTPYRLRKRNIEINYDAEISSDSLDSSSDENDADSVLSETSATSNEQTDKTPLKKTPSSKSRAKVATPSHSKKLTEVEMTTAVENYFEIHSYKGITSDRTLSKLNSPRIGQEDLSKLLQKVLPGHRKECKALFENYKLLFDKWIFLFSNGFNILLYGIGSKKPLIEDFQQTRLKDYDHVVVNGFFPSLSIKHILNCITEEILESQLTFKTPLDQCEFIKNTLESAKRDFYLLIHNIDGVMLRPAKVQNILSFLSKIKGFHIVASIDHINAPLIWDQTRWMKFNWLWCHVTTYMPYQEETSFENSLMVQQSGNLALSSLTHIMRSLTSNAKGIFLLLARYQLDNQDNTYNAGISFQELYQKCRESFLVNSDVALRSQLTEFKDHKLIRSKKSVDGTEQLQIQLDDATLKDFLDSQEDQNK